MDIFDDRKIDIYSEAYSVPGQTSKIEFFAKIVNGFQLLIISEETAILDVWQDSQYIFVLNKMFL